MISLYKIEENVMTFKISFLDSRKSLPFVRGMWKKNMPSVLLPTL